MNYANVPATYRAVEISSMDSKAVARGESPAGSAGLRRESPVTNRSTESPTDLLGAIAQHRSPAAFAALFDLYAGRLKHFFVRGGIDAARAEELTQDVLLAVWRRADSFDPQRSSAATWVYALARNRRIDELRLRGHAAPRAEDLAWDSSWSPSTEGAFEGHERCNLLRDALRALPQEQLSVLQRTFFDGKSLAEVAADSGLPLGTVKSRARLALQRLRRTLHPHEEA
ncbi:MAG: sigma-70 family RNA polymerase sigma factor [Candidatus Binatia bacterium]